MIRRLVAIGLTASVQMAWMCPSAAAQQNACLADFIACVQKTGDPSQCRSVNMQCEDQRGPEPVTSNEPAAPDPPKPAPVLNARMQTDNSDGTLRVWFELSNPGGQASEIFARAITFNCSDGETFLAFFNRPKPLAPGERVTTNPQVICPGAERFTLALPETEKATPIEPRETVVACDEGGSRKFRVQALKYPLVRAMEITETGGGAASMVANIATSSPEDFLKRICEPPAEVSLTDGAISFLRRQSRELADLWGDPEPTDDQEEVAGTTAEPGPEAVVYGTPFGPDIPLDIIDGNTFVCPSGETYTFMPIGTCDIRNYSEYEGAKDWHCVGIFRPVKGGGANFTVNLAEKTVPELGTTLCASGQMAEITLTGKVRSWVLRSLLAPGASDQQGSAKDVAPETREFPGLEGPIRHSDPAAVDRRSDGWDFDPGLGTR